MEPDGAREAAKRIHPDLATDAAEKARRHELMAALNAAYERTDVEAIQRILDGENAWEHYPYNAYYFFEDLYALLDAEWPQALTNCVRIYVGDGKIRNRGSAEYFIRWTTKLENLGRAYPFWRSEREKAHVFAQFEEARAQYARA